MHKKVSVNDNYSVDHRDKISSFVDRRKKLKKKKKTTAKGRKDIELEKIEK